MTRWVLEVLTRFGQEVTLDRDGDVRTFRAFVQPLRERDETVPETLSIGWLDQRRWLCLSREPLEAGDVLEWQNRRFRVRSGRPHYIGDQLSHWRAVLERAREAGYRQRS